MVSESATRSGNDADERIRELIHANLREMAERFADDGTNRTQLMLSTLEAIDRVIALAHPLDAMSFHAFVLHLAAGLDPRAEASRRARKASVEAIEGVRRLRLIAVALATEHRGLPSRAAIVRKIMPTLHKYRDELRAMGLHVPNLNGDRAQRTVSDWLKD